MTVGVVVLLFASDRPAMLFWMMLLRICDPEVPAPSRMPKPNTFALVSFSTVKPSMVTLLAVTLKGVFPPLPEASRMDSMAPGRPFWASTPC